MKKTNSGFVQNNPDAIVVNPDAKKVSHNRLSERLAVMQHQLNDSPHIWREEGTKNFLQDAATKFLRQHGFDATGRAIA
ncbi:hypothetical protein FWD07_03170 [Candidatus Saccharibacteria bacterium]|nr:hypothetical protein [Candidatus Saccharibacteria bacterium]